jgi:antitoxin YefM
VFISEDEYNNILENLYLQTDERYYNELMKSIEQIKTGKLQKRGLIDK